MLSYVSSTSQWIQPWGPCLTDRPKHFGFSALRLLAASIKIGGVRKLELWRRGQTAIRTLAFYTLQHRKHTRTARKVASGLAIGPLDRVRAAFTLVGRSCLSVLADLSEEQRDRPVSHPSLCLRVRNEAGGYLGVHRDGEPTESNFWRKAPDTAMLQRISCDARSPV
ncbi:hypothetical protein PybrP1_011702 [[Pythium] brassicae (nom. inval.)]|nr:hypothetical protein PybrP1_011702 [[Pythium] brassicae (nom. inval.)]